MLKRIFVALILAVATGLSYLWLAQDISPRQLPAAAALVVGLGAKIACSSRYLSGFDQATIQDDLATYSGMTRYLDFQLLDEGGVRASFPTGTRAVARYRPGLGCTLEYGPSALDRVTVPAHAVDTSRPWPAGSRVEATDPGMQALLDELMQADNAAGQKTRALLVVQNGRLLAETYAAGVSRDTPLLGWSMGKSITAIMLGRLEALGLADVSEARLFPAWEQDERASITLENMLQMSSGLAFSEEYVPGNDSTRMLFMSPNVWEIPLASPMRHEPGTHFSYSSGTTNLLSRLVFERVGNSPQAQVDFFHREFVQPLALENTILEMDTTGVMVGSSYVYATARDWARFGQLMIAGGEINGHRVLSRDWVRRAVEPNSSDNDGRYGYQFWLNGEGENKWWPSLPAQAYAMQGNRKQVVMMLPGLAAVIVRLGWSAGEYPVDANFARIAAALQR